VGASQTTSDAIVEGVRTPTKEFWASSPLAAALTTPWTATPRSPMTYQTHHQEPHGSTP